MQTISIDVRNEALDFVKIQVNKAWEQLYARLDKGFDSPTMKCDENFFKNPVYASDMLN